MASPSAQALSNWEESHVAAFKTHIVDNKNKPDFTQFSVFTKVPERYRNAVVAKRCMHAIELSLQKERSGLMSFPRIRWIGLGLLLPLAVLLVFLVCSVSISTAMAASLTAGIGGVAGIGIHFLINTWKWKKLYGPNVTLAAFAFLPNTDDSFEHYQAKRIPYYHLLPDTPKMINHFGTNHIWEFAPLFEKREKDE